MSNLRVDAFTISLDGHGAGPDQSLANPLGVGGEGLHRWFVDTRTFRHSHSEMTGTAYAGDGRGGVDDDFGARSMANLGAWIMGRNMFAPSRGSWPDDDWKGWWGSNPPYHVPVFVLTHHPRAPITMEGGTTFHFVTDGIHAALERARAAAGDKDIRIGGGAATIRQYLTAGLVDSLHVAISPVLLGRGEPLFTGIDMPALGYQVTERVTTEHAMHVVMTRSRR